MKASDLDILLQKNVGTKSVRRNPLIADLLHRIDFIEKAGTGIRRMREGAKALGYPAPEFSAGGFFSAVFWPIRKEGIVTPQVTPQVTPEAGGKSGAGRAYVPENEPINEPINEIINELINEPVNERQRWFLTQMFQHIQVKAEDIMERWDVSRATAKRDIAQLRNLGLIEFSGALKTGGYRLKQSEEADS